MQHWLLIPAVVFLAVAGSRFLFFPHRAKDGGFRVFQSPATSFAYRIVGAVFCTFGFLVAMSAGFGVPSFESAHAARNEMATSQPLWMPYPALASRAPADPRTSNELCKGAVETRVRLAHAQIRPAVLGYVVERDGSVNDIRVASSSGSTGLDMAIALCVATLRFQPPANGQPLLVQPKQAPE